MWQKVQALTNLPLEHPRQKGMITAFDVQTDNPYFARDCYQAGLAHGILIRPIGNTVYWMPPYVISEAEIDQLASGTQQAIIESL